MQMCVGKLTIIGSDNGLLPGRRQVIIWTNAVILLIVPLGTNFNEILSKIYTNACENGVNMAAILSRPQCVNLPAIGGFPHIGTVFDIFFDVTLEKRLKKQSSCLWFKAQ